jgi:hypothetical protein
MFRLLSLKNRQEPNKKKTDGIESPCAPNIT